MSVEKINGLKVQFISEQSGWKNYMVERVKKLSRQRVRGKGWNRFYIAWNGDRFSGSGDLVQLKRQFPKSANAILDSIIQGI